MFANNQGTQHSDQLVALEAALRNRLGSRVRALEVCVDNGQLIQFGH